MLKIFKYMKKTWISIIIIVILLVIDAIGDLTLPDYTSKIVNIGIQNGGIENAIPIKLSNETMLQLLNISGEYELLLSSYDKENNIYTLKQIPEEKEEMLNETLKIAFTKISFIKTYINNFDFNDNDYINTSVYESMENQEINNQEMQTMLNNQIAQMPENIIEQTAVQTIKEEYKILGVNTDNIQNKYIATTGLKMLVIAFIIMTTSILITLLSARVGARLAKTLREKIFSKVLKFSNKEFAEYSTASLITRSTNDIQQIQLLVSGMLFRTLIYAPIIGIGGFVKVLLQSDNSMAWIIGTLFIIAIPKFKKLQD